MNSTTAQLKHNLATAAPYLLIVVVACFTALICANGTPGAQEGAYLSLVDEFYRGAVPFDAEYSSAQFFVPFVLPLYILQHMTCSGSTGAILFMRYAYVAVGMIVALVVAKTIKPHSASRHASVLIGLAIVLICPCGLQVFTPAALAMWFTLLGGLAIWRGWDNAGDDDGQPGMARVLQPLVAGACLTIAAFSMPWLQIPFVLALVVGFVYATIKGSHSRQICLVWLLVGVLVVLAMVAFLFVLPRCGSLGTYFSGISSTFGGLLGYWGSVAPDWWGIALVVLVAVVLGASRFAPEGAKEDYDAFMEGNPNLDDDAVMEQWSALKGASSRSKAISMATTLVACAALLMTAATFGTGSSYAYSHDGLTKVQSGAAAGLYASDDFIQRYSELKSGVFAQPEEGYVEIASADAKWQWVGMDLRDECLVAFAGDSLAALQGSDAYKAHGHACGYAIVRGSAKGAYPQWLASQMDSADNYGAIMHDGAVTLYKRAEAIGTIG